MTKKQTQRMVLLLARHEPGPLLRSRSRLHFLMACFWTQLASRQTRQTRCTIDEDTDVRDLLQQVARRRSEPHLYQAASTGERWTKCGPHRISLNNTKLRARPQQSLAHANEKLSSHRDPSRVEAKFLDFLLLNSTAPTQAYHSCT